MAIIICKVCKREKKTRPHHQFCSRECLYKYKKTKSEERKQSFVKECKQCGKTFRGHNKDSVFCSTACLYESRRVLYDRECVLCGKKFQVNNIYEIQRGNHKFCSRECSQKKFHFDENDYLTEQNAEKIYWLGFMFASIESLEDEFACFVDEGDMINGFKKFISGTMPLSEKYDGRQQMMIRSRPYSRYLSLIGLRTDYYKEAPLIEREYVKDFIRGFFDSKRGFVYKDSGKNVVSIHGEDSKLMRWISDMLEARLVYHNKEWVVICEEFEFKCLGFPRNKKKWKKLGFGSDLF